MNSIIHIVNCVFAEVLNSLNLFLQTRDLFMHGLLWKSFLSHELSHRCVILKYILLPGTGLSQGVLEILQRLIDTLRQFTCVTKYSFIRWHLGMNILLLLLRNDDVLCLLLISMKLIKKTHLVFICGFSLWLILLIVVCKNFFQSLHCLSF